MVRRFGVSLLTLALWLAAAGGVAAVQGCAGPAAITPQETVEQPTRDRPEPRRDRRVRDLQRKEYDA